MNTSFKIFSIAITIILSLASCGSDENQEEITLELEGETSTYLGLRTAIDSLQSEITALKLPTALLTRPEPRVQTLVTILDAYKSEFTETSQLIIIPENTTVVSKEEIYEPLYDTSETHTWTEGNDTLRFTIYDAYVSYNFYLEVIGENGEVLDKRLEGKLFRDSATVREATLYPFENGVQQPGLQWVGRATKTTTRIKEGNAITEYSINGETGNFQYYTDAIYNTSEVYRWKDNGNNGNYDNIDDDTEDMFWF